MKTAFISVLALLALSSCSLVDTIDGQPELTSPCVGLDDSPCGPKRPVNMWLYKKGVVPSQAFS